MKGMRYFVGARFPRPFRRLMCQQQSATMQARKPRPCESLDAKTGFLSLDYFPGRLRVILPYERFHKRFDVARAAPENRG